MSFLKVEDTKKWISAFLVLVAILISFVAIKILQELGIYLELESKIPQYVLLVQVVSALIGLLSFIFAYRHTKTMNYLTEVYGELLKVTWPDRAASTRLTFIIVGIVIVLSIIFSLIDWLLRLLLGLIY